MKIVYGCSSSKCFLSQEGREDILCTCLKGIPNLQKQKILACINDLKKENIEIKKKSLNNELLNMKVSEPGY
jgi:hypothetical protein